MIASGIDVGCVKKGFHAVALQGTKVLGTLNSGDVDKVVDWCIRQKADVVAIDAPCRWTRVGKSQPAEQQLMANRILCYSTPQRQIAIEHRTNFYGWVLRGERLFSALEKHFPLFDGPSTPLMKTCFETFPHAVTWHLTSGAAVGKLKRTQRRKLLQDAEIDTTCLTNIDFIDAALCAHAAQYFAKQDYFAYGEKETGFIVVPNFR